MARAGQKTCGFVLVVSGENGVESYFVFAYNIDVSSTQCDDNDLHEVDEFRFHCVVLFVS